MADLATVEVVPNEVEAELLCSLLREAGIECMYRQTDTAAGALGGLGAGGAQEVVVRAEDLAAAREVLAAQQSADET
jgi:hypothetical protein